MRWSETSEVECHAITECEYDTIHLWPIDLRWKQFRERHKEKWNKASLTVHG